jgi:hypothetical protein
MPGASLMTGRLRPDARFFQIAALGSLLCINFALIDFGARPLPSVVAIGTCLLTQLVCPASPACRSSTCGRR